MLASKNQTFPNGSYMNDLVALLLVSLAAGMGWGIRGQYGHESGAMIAGTLASLTIVLLFIPNANSLFAARAAAMMTVGIGIGGTMTYGQTIGLTQDRDLVGNWEALRWGLIGLFIKGGIWISFAGAFLGMGLSGKSYRPLEMLLVMSGLIGLLFMGLWLLNSPFDPANKLLPRFYFSGNWYFQPDKVDLKPRREVWGGLLVALLGLLCYCGLVRRDSLALRLGLIGFLGGGFGFAGGQCIQAFHSWNTELFKTGALSSYKVFGYVNWWNMMEITFGLVFGAVMAWGVWLNRHLIDSKVSIKNHSELNKSDDTQVWLSPTMEMALIAVHLVLLLNAEFLQMPKGLMFLSRYTDGLYMCVLPIIGIVGGRIWPYAHLLPIVAAPICGKEIRALVYGEPQHYSIGFGWLMFAMIPVGISIVMATWLISKSYTHRARELASIGLIATVLLYFGLNTYFFHQGWPWLEWTSRTPSQCIFMICSISLIATAAFTWLRRRHNES
jgi:hypothetical protein